MKYLVLIVLMFGFCTVSEGQIFRNRVSSFNWGGFNSVRMRTVQRNPRVLVVPRVQSCPNCQPAMNYKMEFKSEFKIESGYQEEAENQAKERAMKGISGHIGPVIGDFEGVGVSSSLPCPTCVPPAGYRLVADSTVQNPQTKMYYRVRGWVRY